MIERPDHHTVLMDYAPYRDDSGINPLWAAGILVDEQGLKL